MPWLPPGKPFPPGARLPWNPDANTSSDWPIRLRAARHELAAWEVFEVGKTWAEADADVVEAIDFCTFYSHEMRRLDGGRLTQDLPGEISIEGYLPRGVGCHYCSLEFSTRHSLRNDSRRTRDAGTQSCSNRRNSLLCWEPSLWVSSRKLGYPTESPIWSCGTGEDVGSLLVAHPDVDLIAFTGSREVGTLIWGTAAVTHR